MKKIIAFSLQMKLFKLCGIERYPTKQKSILSNVLVILNLFIAFYCVFCSAAYAYDVKDFFEYQISLLYH